MINVLKNLFILLSAKEKRNLFLLCCLMVLNALVQIFGIAAVAPLIAAITSPENVAQIPYISDIQNHFNYETHQELSVFLGFIILAIMIVGNTVILLTNYLSMRYSNNRERSIGGALLGAYIAQPYIFFLDRHSSELLRNVYNEVAYISSNIISRFLNLLTFSISALGIIIFIFVINPVVTSILAGILGGAYFLIYLLVKKPLYALGKRYVALTETKLKAVTDSIRLIKDLKMQALEGMFLKRFSDAASEYSKVRTSSDIAGVAPKYIIEVFAIGALVFAIIYLVSTSKNSDELLPILGVYAFAGFRLMPALQQIFLALSRIQFSAHSLDLIANEMRKYKPIAIANNQKDVPLVDFQNSFGLKKASFSYSSGGDVVHDLNVKILKGQNVAFVGRSGEGKSTIVDLLVGLTTPNKGHLRVDENVISEAQLAGWRNNIAYTAQNIYLLDETVDMNIVLESDQSLWDLERLQLAKETAFVNFDAEVNGTVGENGQRLSGGQKQRIGLARALYQNKQILILDEATSAMDHQTEKDILDKLETLDKTLIFVTHRVETLTFCDVIYVIKSGEIKDYGTFEDLRNCSSLFNQLLSSKD